MSLIASRASFDTIDVPRDDSDGLLGFSREWKGPIHSSRQIKLCDDDDNVIIILFYKIMVLVCRLDLM
jgi:hypothetical protein